MASFRFYQRNESTDTIHTADHNPHKSIQKSMCVLDTVQPALSISYKASFSYKAALLFQDDCTTNEWHDDSVVDACKSKIFDSSPRGGGESNADFLLLRLRNQSVSIHFTGFVFKALMCHACPSDALHPLN